MPFGWPIVKFLFKVVAPTLPEIVSTISKMRKQDGEPQTYDQHEQLVEHRLADLDRRLALQLDLIDTLTTQLAAFQVSIRRALTIGMIALVLSGIALAWLVFTR